MCGIAGVVRQDYRSGRIEADCLSKMAAELIHRGPDDAKDYLDPAGRCGLAFRRLAIIDLVTGAQPIANEDETIWLVFNGEIYNYRELRIQLEHQGHSFRTQSDSEVIVHLYEQHGVNCFAQLAGMFAIAIWDQRAERLVLARDRFGKKPLVYTALDGHLYFASEQKALLALPALQRRINPQALHEYLVFQYVPAPHSIYAGVNKLPPGHYLAIDTGVAAPSIPQRYYSLPRPPRFAGTYAAARDRVGELLEAAVQRRLVADVPLGAFLSGGVDSSIVVGLMHRLGVSPLRTFCIGFADPHYDETAAARAVAERFQTEHHEQRVTPQVHEVLEKLAWLYDEPFADSSAIPTYFVSQYTRQFATVALTGDGGDECFSGYDRYRAAQLAARFDAWPALLRSGLARLAGARPPARPRTLRSRVYRFLSALRGSPAERYLSWMNVFPPADLIAGYRPEFAERLDLSGPQRWFDQLYDAEPEDGVVERAVRCDYQSYLPNDLLVKVDLASMGCSLECRAPFLDHELIEFALSLPVEWRLGRRGGKHILKDWAQSAGLLTPEILDRPKMGFGVPVGAWMRRELRELVHEALFAPSALVQRIFRPEWLQRLVHEHLSSAANHEHRLWALLMLELWQRRWMAELRAD